jgi:5-methylcytosine-specific restriction endonuclease McrA
LHSKEYEKYIKSEQWEAKRQERIKIDGCCVMCGRPLDKIRSVQVHHISYERLGAEDVYTDLVTLCGTCHRRLHNYYNRIRNPNDSRLRNYSPKG